MKKTKVITIVAAFLLILTAASMQSKFEQPLLITSAGQSSDLKLVELIANREKLKNEAKLLTTNADLNGIKTLIVVPGFSSKGLGAAGISQQDEIRRVENLVKAASDRKIPIVLVHVGGKARRGGQSDDFCKLIADHCQYMIVVKQGNEDGFFTQIAKRRNVPLVEVDNVRSAGAPLKEIFSN